MKEVIPVLLLSAALFVIGLTGLAMSRGHLVRLLIALEIMMVSVHILFVAFSKFHGAVEGQIFSLFILGIGVSEAVIGLSLLISFFQRFGKGEINDTLTLKG